MTDFYQIMAGGEPIIWDGDGECRWFDEAAVAEVLRDVDRSINPRHIRVWKIDPTQFEGLYSSPHVTDVTREIAERMINAKMAEDAGNIEPDTRPESFFGAFAYFHQPEYCVARPGFVERIELGDDLHIISY